MANIRRSKWWPIKKHLCFEYRGTIDHNLSHLEKEYVEGINNTLVRVSKGTLDKYSSKRAIKTVKRRERLKQLKVRRREMENANAQEYKTFHRTISKLIRRDIRKFNTALITKTIQKNESLKIMRKHIGIGTKEKK